VAARLNAALPPGTLEACREQGHAAVADLPLQADSLETLMAGIGPLVFTPGERPLSGSRFVFEVTNRGRVAPPRSVFHSDTSYVAAPPSFTALAAIEIPASGGETVFVNQFDALDAAPASLRTALVGVEFLHVASRVADPAAAGEGAWHPVLRRHPDVDRVALYVSARERLIAARRHGEPLDEAQARELIPGRQTCRCTGAPVHRHVWRPGDLLLTDNRSTLHAADHSAVDGVRTLYRVMVAGEVPVAG